MDAKEKIEDEGQNKEPNSLIMDLKREYKGQEYDGIREMVKAIKKSLGPRRVDWFCFVVTTVAANAAES